MKKYIISPATFFCDEEEMFYTKVGLDEIDMPLLYTVWGSSEVESIERAQQLVNILNFYHS